MTADTSWLESMPEVYDRCLGLAVFAPFGAELALRAADLNPSRVLEIAAGTGIVTAGLVEALPDAEITATDLNPPMVDYASTRVPGPRGGSPTPRPSTSTTTSSTSWSASSA